MDKSIIEKIRNNIDIIDVASEYLSLNKKGRNYWSLCPFHEDSNPSLSISPKKQMFKCFVCNEGGDVIKLVSKLKNISFQEALIFLASRIGIDLKIKNKKEIQYSLEQQEILKVCAEAMNFFNYSLSINTNYEVKNYLQKRSLTPEIINKFSIGYAPKTGLINFLQKKGYKKDIIFKSGLSTENNYAFFVNRLIFGIKNIDNKIVAFSGRIIDEKNDKLKSKYINSPETSLFLKSHLLYNFANAQLEIVQKKEIIITEGYMDVIALYRSNIKNVVATMGTYLSKYHLQFIKKYHIVLMFDNDQAGKIATKKTIDFLLSNYLLPLVIIFDEGKDSDEILKKYGSDKLVNIVKNNQQEAIGFIYRYFKDEMKNINAYEINLFLQKMKNYFKYYDPITLDYYANICAKDFNIDKSLIVDKWKIQTINNAYNQKNITTNNVHKFYKNYQNNSHKVILSMIKNSNFVDIFQKYNISFHDPVLIAIYNYLLSLKNKKNNFTLTDEMKTKIKDIMESGDFVEKEDEFIELIKRIGKEGLEKILDIVNVKLHKTNDDKKKMNLLKQQSNIKKCLYNYSLKEKEDEKKN